MTTVTIELSLRELELAERSREPSDPEFDDRDLLVADEIPALVDELKSISEF